MKKYKVAICDDIKEYILSIKAYTKEYFSNNRLYVDIDEYQNGSDLLRSNTCYDILFLDVELGDTNGIEIAKKFRNNNQNTIIIIVTSYRKYLDDAMDINVTRFIDKPISQERITSALEKAFSVLKTNIISVHSKDNHIIRIPVNSIVYCEARVKKVLIFTIEDEYTVKEPLKNIRSSLLSMQFATPHNSYIVNMNHIRDFYRKEIKLIKPYDDVTIPIAPRKQKEFKKVFLNYIGENAI